MAILGGTGGGSDRSSESADPSGLDCGRSGVVGLARAVRFSLLGGTLSSWSVCLVVVIIELVVVGTEN
jgi:hypothetical protein